MNVARPALLVRLAGALALSVALVACDDGSGNAVDAGLDGALAGGDAGGLSGLDAASPSFDAGARDAAAPSMDAAPMMGDAALPDAGDADDDAGTDPADAGADAAPSDAAPADAAPADGSTDGGAPDAEAADASVADASIADASLDAEVPDAAPADAALPDGGTADAAPADASLDAGAADGSLGDGGPGDAGVAEPAPRYAEADVYAATIPTRNDPADIYYPKAVASGTRLPVALLLQGANVGRANYQRYARRIARYGFIVVVPDHPGLLGLFAEQQQVPDTLAFMAAEDTRAGSPVRGLVDTAAFVLLGHSYGGVAALGAVQGTCNFPFCLGGFTRPAALRAAALYGTNNGNSTNAIPHGSIAVALLQGALDSKATPAETALTYQALATPPRALVTLAGANHYGLCDVNNPSGAAPEDVASTRPQAELVDRTADAAGCFLRAALGDASCKGWLALRATTPEPNLSITLDYP